MPGQLFPGVFLKGNNKRDGRGKNADPPIVPFLLYRWDSPRLRSFPRTGRGSRRRGKRK